MFTPKICTSSNRQSETKFCYERFKRKGTLRILPFYKSIPYLGRSSYRDFWKYVSIVCNRFQLKSKKPEVKSNWRRKHEEFINAIRSAKQVQAHLAAGGRLSDLPPPPVSDTSDYIQCPHCGRKFNQAAAERHIPKCEHMLHNKPSSRAPPRPRR